jgi:hypothetical protein
VATTDELRARAGADFGHVVFFDGIGPGFGDREGVLAYTPGSHSVRAGLVKAGTSLPESGNLRTGQFNDDTATITIEDLYGDLAAFFRARDPSERSLGDVPLGLGTPVHPLSDLTGRPELDAKNIGTERIGANGARHQYPVPTNYTIGLDHSISLPGIDLAGAPVSDEPIVWRGRRVVVYRVYRDHITYPGSELTGWRPFDEAIEIWRGTVTDEGEVQGRMWRLECDGPGSWQRKALGLNFSKTPVRAVGDFDLVTSGEAREDGMAMTLQLLGPNGVVANYGTSMFVTDITGTTADDIVDQVAAELAATAAATGVDGVWDEQANHHVAMTTDGTIQIAVDAQLSASIPPGVNAGVVNICLHRKVWAIIGYDVEYQRSLEATPEDPRAVTFSPVWINGTFNEANDFGPDYWTGYFPTGRLEWPNDDGLALSNNGVMRQYKPLHSNGTAILLAGLNEGRGQVIRLLDAALGGGASGTTVVHPGQLAWPVASLPGDPTSPIEIDGTPCDRCGWWLFTGKRRYAGTEEVYDEAWIGLANWVNGGAQQDGMVSGDAIIVTHWFNPKLFGYSTKGGVDSDWIALAEAGEAEGQIQAQPIIMLGYHSAPDLAHVVLQRILVGSGTCEGWDAPELDGPTLAAGDNEPAGVTDGIRRDAEIASLGLGIPEDLVATPAAFDAEAALVEEAAILDVKIGIPAGFSSVDVFRAIMQPLGWSWHIREGRYGIFCPASPLTIADATVELSRSVKKAEYADEGERQSMANDLRKWAPVDEWVIDYDARAGDGKAGRKLELNSPDRGLRYRPGGVRETVPALFHHEAHFSTRLDMLARFWALRHFEVRSYPVDRYTGEQCRFGTIVSITDPELVDALGSYGVTDRVGIVTSGVWDLDEGIKTLSIMVRADRSATPRLHAPLAQGIGYDTATSRLYVADDWAGFGNGWADAAGFVAASWMPLGGNALIQVEQWDGDVWAVTLTGTVTGVVTTPGSAYLQLSATSGTYFVDRDTWVTFRPSNIANAAWVETYFAPIADDGGEWTDGAAAAQDYIPWEA